MTLVSFFGCTKYKCPWYSRIPFLVDSGPFFIDLVDSQNWGTSSRKNVFGKNLDVFFDFWWVLALFYQFLVKKLGLFFRSQKCVWEKSGRVFRFLVGFGPVLPIFGQKTWSIF